MTIEYRLKRVERFIVTKHEDHGETSSSRQVGKEYDKFDTAYEVAAALARSDQDRLGLAPGEDGVVFPSQSIEDARQAR